mmetsp:Transcript_15542/g.37637  ORF Transcript_15542/g.37637 Transcript_15542/m.37637 type:complete len:502 (+) Transcript_15542:536-2041(+)
MTLSWITLMPLVGPPYAALSATTSAASLPASTAPSMDPRNFWLVQSPASVKLEMGVAWLGRYLLRPGMAAYTLRGVFTTACFSSTAPTPSGDPGPISSGNRRSSSSIVASMMSWLLLAIQLVLPPASGEHGANTSSSMDLLGSKCSLHVVLMSAYTDSSGERLKHRWSMPVSLRSNHMWMLITGMPSSSWIWWKYGMVAHGLGIMRFMTSTGMALTYSSATISSPLVISRCFTLPSSFSTNSLRRFFMRTSPPRALMWSTMGAHSRAGWLPSRNAICRPSVSLRKRFMAVSTTVMDSLSGSMKSRALAMEMNTSSLMRSGMPYLRMKSCTLSSSCASMKSCPSISIGISGGAVCSFSCSVSISLLSRMARPKLKGAGMPLTKSKVVNCPGSSCMAKIILCTFHCRRSSMSSSAKRFIMLGYAPKKMCRPVSIQSPSLSCHALTLPPSTGRPSSTMGSWPASARYLAHARPDRPPPTMATRFFFAASPFTALNLLESASATR